MLVKLTTAEKKNNYTLGVEKGRKQVFFSQSESYISERKLNRIIALNVITLEYEMHAQSL
jgi:hypothetical protein